MMRIVLIYLGFFLSGFFLFKSSDARDMPVLPFPRYVKQGGEIKQQLVNVKLVTKGLNKLVARRLNDHWNNSFSISPADKEVLSTYVSLQLIGNNKGINIKDYPEYQDYSGKLGSEGYILILENDQKVIAANTEKGLFYGLQSLKQLIRSGWNSALFIADWPELAHRIIYDDISRGPISTVNYIKHQIERLAEIKVNGLSFYIEHVVQPISHSDFAPDSGKLTIPQIRELSAYAAAHHMQLIGSFQSFGHFEKILALPQYKSMGETSTLISPLDPNARKFLENVIGELCEAFRGPFFNVNCDETFDLTKGKSKNYIDSIGAARFYADHLRFLYDVLKKHNKRMMMWGDVALEHEEVLDLLPSDIVYLTWEYGDKKSYDNWILPFKKRGLEFMVCPGILNSYRMFPDMAMATSNIRGFIDDGVKYGSTGAITTIWDDGGTYLFSGDWYGVYVAADKSWNPKKEAYTSFDHRYVMNAYGTENTAYVKAVFKLMELRALAITYNLNDQVWRQKILPDSAQELIVNNSSAPAAIQILNQAASFISIATAERNQDDINTLRFAIDQYRLIVDTRLILADIAARYKSALPIASSSSSEAGLILQRIKDSLNMLSERYIQLKDRFSIAWRKENQPYWLDIVTDTYRKKISDLQDLAVNMDKAKAALSSAVAIPEPSMVRLKITESEEYYFQNWMLAGPFPFNPGEQLPAFLYSGNEEYNRPPIPGDFTHYNNKTYRWQKFASQDGGIIDLDEHYQSPNYAFAYAYCSVNSEKAVSAKAYIESGNNAEIFCNGVKLYDYRKDPGTSLRQSFDIPFKEGLNHILIKLPKTLAGSWNFSFHLEKELSVTTHKHKYQLNPKKIAYEAD